MSNSKSSDPTSSNDLSLDQAFDLLVVAYNQNQLQHAEEIGLAVIRQVNHPPTLAVLALIYIRLGRMEDVVKIYDSLLVVSPNYVTGHINRGSALQSLKRFSSAIASYDEAILRGGASFDVFFQRGVCLQLSGRPIEAVQSFENAIQINSEDLRAWIGLGAATQSVGRLDRALEIYDAAITKHPECAELHNNRGTVLQLQGRTKEALASYEAAALLDPGYADAFNNIGTVLQDSGQLQLAMENYLKAITIKPEYSAAYCNLGTVCYSLGQPARAISQYDRAIALDPQDHEAIFNKSLSLLLIGNYAEGWRLHEHRWSRHNSPQKKWATFPLLNTTKQLEKKKLLLWGEQGLGDQIQFSRYVAKLEKLASEIVLEVSEPLVRIFSESFPSLSVVPPNSSFGNHRFDYQCPLMTLPLLCATTMTNIPPPTSFRVSNKVRQYWASRIPFSQKKRIGVVWSGGDNPRLRNRSIPLKIFSALFSADFQWISLQKEVRESDSPELKRFSNVLHFGEEQNDLLDAAGICSECDLVITVDTGVAHLAASLGRPVWILIPSAPDWRWGLTGNDTPWYPAATLYRMRHDEDWGAVVARVASDLIDFRV